MKRCLTILRCPPGTEGRDRLLHHLWLWAGLTLMGCGIGLLTLAFAATAYLKLPGEELMASYFQNPLILCLNLLVPVLLMWMFYLLTRRAWAAYLVSFLLCVGVALVNYYKIRLRSDPFVAADLLLASEAGGIMGNYTLELTWLVWFALACLVGGVVFAAVLMPNGLRGWKCRTIGTLTVLAALLSAALLCMNPTIYTEKTKNEGLINQWSDVEVFVSKGCLYPFLYSMRGMLPAPPEGYDSQAAADLLAMYEESVPVLGDLGPAISRDKEVSVMGIMLEAFCDLTDLEALADHPGVQAAYAPWHTLEAQSISGTLLTNIFAGGTVDSEWCFLTGYSEYDTFRRPTDSYVWYLREQGYQTFGSHPGYGWFYNRQNINAYLGFEEYWFSENHYAGLVDPVAAAWNSDHILMEELLNQLRTRVKDGPCFSFSVTYQNHGPYDETPTSGVAYLKEGDAGLSQQSCNIWNNYLNGLAKTMDALTRLVAGLEEMEEPVVLVLFGDHKPWGGNGNTAYAEMGVDFDFGVPDGFRNYYGTPYLIWANAAAKQTLDNPFRGEGRTISPCFLMAEVFDQCGWRGPAYMELSREVRDITPLVHTQGLYLLDETLTSTLPQPDADFLQKFRWAQYYREKEIHPNES